MLIDLDIEDCQEIQKFIESDEFSQFLLEHTTSFASAAWILQTLMTEYNKLVDTINGDTEVN